MADGIMIIVLILNWCLEHQHMFRLLQVVLAKQVPGISQGRGASLIYQFLVGGHTRLFNQVHVDALTNGPIYLNVFNYFDKLSQLQVTIKHCQK